MNETSSRRNGDAIEALTAAQYHDVEAVIAETAGRNTWQTWAGRKHGTGDFEYLDVFRGIRRSISYNLGTKVPKSGTLCPICFCDPCDGSSSSSSSSSSQESPWHVTWCGHAVCKDCLGQYATNQVKDKEQSGPLKCPVCLKNLRKEDAVVALMAGKHNANNADLIKQWDLKIRDQLLRAIPSFRACPKCGNGGKNSVTCTKVDGSFGGGFVTPECLRPQYQERREEAIKILLKRNYGYASILFVYLLLVAIVALTKSPSAKLDLWSMILPIYVFTKLGMALNYLLARKAREELFRSISVECPCCDEAFVLPAQSTQLEDEETSRWVKTNTRQCPSCSVPISKAGGCNHVKCSHCGAVFCWACMRLRTACRAYRCQNDAPYQNASLFDNNSLRERSVPRVQALQRDGSVLEYVDYILNRRRCPELGYGDGFFVLVCLLGRHFGVVQLLEREVLAPLLDFLYEKFMVVSSIFMVVCPVFLAIPFDWIANLRAFFARHEQTYSALLVISVISLFSLPLGVSLGLGYFINEILPALQVQGQQPLPEREGERPEPEQRNRPLADIMDETMLNEALRRSIEDT